MKIVCRYRKTIIMNSVYELKNLISNCSESDSELSSLCEGETTFIRREACSDESIVVTIGKQIENQNAYTEEEQNCLNNFEYCSKNEHHDDPWSNQKTSTESSISEIKNPLDKQLHNLSEELKEPLTENQDNIRDDQDSLLADSNVGKLKESLQNSPTEKVSKIQCKILPKVSNDNTIVQMVVLSDKL